MGRVHRLALAGVTIGAAALLTLSGCAGAAPAPPQTADSFAPDPTPAPDTSARLQVAGDEEVVFDWSADACEPKTIPDLAARAFRGGDGRGQPDPQPTVNYRMTGSTLDDLAVDCTPILKSAFDADPAHYLDSSWIAATHTDGDTIYAVVHHEYRGHTHFGVCPTKQYADCLDTSLTLMSSTDGGAHFAPAVAPPATTWRACRSRSKRGRDRSASGPPAI